MLFNLVKVFIELTPELFELKIIENLLLVQYCNL